MLRLHQGMIALLGQNVLVDHCPDRSRDQLKFRTARLAVNADDRFRIYTAGIPSFCHDEKTMLPKSLNRVLAKVQVSKEVPFTLVLAEVRAVLLQILPLAPRYLGHETLSSILLWPSLGVVLRTNITKFIQPFLTSSFSIRPTPQTRQRVVGKGSTMSGT